MLTLLTQLQSETMRLRKTHPDISVAVKQGMFQIQMVTYRKNGTSIVKPVSDWLHTEALFKALREFK